MSYSTEFVSPWGELSLFRYSRSRTRTEANLQAWDAADSLLLEHLAGLDRPLGQLLILNDANGALACSIAQTGIASRLISAGDSWVARRAAEENLQHNGLSGVEFWPSLEMPPGEIDLVVIRLPKSLRLLADQLCRYRPLLKPACQVVFAGMVKHMSPGHFNVIESKLGSTCTSLARKKARLIFAAPEQPVHPVPEPVQYEYEGRPVLALANVFSGESLDIGARCLLSHFPDKVPNEPAAEIADLGCGNGILGLWAGHCFPEAHITFFDESHMAVASAQQNAQQWNMAERCDAVCDDGMASAEDESFDLILCNPPFHQQQVVGDFIARQMFHDARRCLKPGGELWVVANRHMNYHQLLKRLFGHCHAESADKKFVVLKVVKA